MVARETLIAENLRAMGLGTTAAEKLATLWNRLETIAIPRGFVGPGEGERLLVRHILDCAALARFLPADGSVVDVGSGAGLPGLVLASLLRGPVRLIESDSRRCGFLESTATAMGVSAEVVRARAEDAGRGPLREVHDAATARAVASPPVALELTLPLIRPGGVLALAVGRSSLDGESPDAATINAARILGGGEPAVYRTEVPGAEQPRWVMIVNKAGVTDARYPRRAGIPAKRPISP